MKNIFVEGTFPVAIKVLDGQTELKIKDFKLRSLTVEESLDIQTATLGKKYIGVVELCGATDLIDADGKVHTLEYDAFINSSTQNLRYLENKKVELDAKESAED